MKQLKKITALAISDLRITLRRSEALVLNLIVPMIVLVALSNTSTGVDDAIPFVYLQAVLATSMVSLGITTGFDRRFRVLVRLGTTPLGRRGLVFSKILSMGMAQLLQLTALSILGLFLGWNIDPLWVFALPFCWIASCAFAGIALMIAGNVRAEANLGLQNLLYIFMIGVGAVSFGGLTLPDTLENISFLVPSASFHSLLRWCAGLESFPTVAFVVLVAQAVIFPLLAARKFSFDES